MIRIKLKHAIADREFKERRRVTLAEVSSETGVSLSTLTRMANVPGYNAELDAIDALCGYFKCQPGELLEHIANDEGSTESGA